MDRNTVTIEELQALNPEVSAATVKDIHDLTLRKYSERPFTYYDEEDAMGVWVNILHTNTYGADPNSCHLIETNERAALDMIGDDITTGYDKGMLVVLVCDENGIIDEDAMNVAEEIQKSLEDYPLLDEDGYSDACWEEAADSLDDAIWEEVRDLDADMEAELEDLDLDATDILQAAAAAGDLQWWEEECFPRFDKGVVHDALASAISERREEHALAESMAATCPRTLDLFGDE